MKKRRKKITVHDVAKATGLSPALCYYLLAFGFVGIGYMTKENRKRL